MYATPEDMITRFGECEIHQLVDKCCSGVDVADLPTNEHLLAKLADACAEMNVLLSCCYDIKVLKQYLDADPANEIPVLKHWQCDIARKHLYDCLEGEDHQAYREYKDYEEEIKKICECGQLLDKDFNVFPKRTVFSLSEDSSCVPPAPCCKCSPCKCGGLETNA